MTIGRKAPRTPEQLQQAWTKSIMEGTLSGKVVNAAPVTLGSKLAGASRAAAGTGGTGTGGGATLSDDPPPQVNYDASDAGTAETASRGDHTHQSVQFAYDYVVVT